MRVTGQLLQPISCLRVVFQRRHVADCSPWERGISHVLDLSMLLRILSHPVDLLDRTIDKPRHQVAWRVSFGPTNCSRFPLCWEIAWIETSLRRSLVVQGFRPIRFPGKDSCGMRCLWSVHSAFSRNEFPSLFVETNC